jgi:predicted RNase H-like HicB family nuclease
MPSDTIHVRVEYFTGLEEGAEDTGYPYYVASCDELVAVTDGRTWPELLRNIHDMIETSLEGEDTVAVYNLTPNPRVVITMELPENYAEIA